MLHLQGIEQQQEISLDTFYSHQTAPVFCYGFHTTVKRKVKSNTHRERERERASIARLECVGMKAPRFQLRIDH